MANASLKQIRAPLFSFRNGIWLGDLISVNEDRSQCAADKWWSGASGVVVQSPQIRPLSQPGSGVTCFSVVQCEWHVQFDR